MQHSEGQPEDIIGIATTVSGVVSGPTGQDYSVQATTNPTSPIWITVLQTNSPPIPFSFTDPSSGTKPLQFYRVVTGHPLP